MWNDQHQPYWGDGSPGSPQNPDSMPTDPNTAPDAGQRYGGGYSPEFPGYPGGQPPRWPDPQQPATPPAAPRPRPEPPAPQQQYQPAYQAPAARTQTGRGLPRPPIAHVILVVGIAAMALALTQAWGVNGAGTAIYIGDFSNARLQSHGVDVGALALETARFLVIVTAALGAVLIFFNVVTTVLNKVLGVVGVPGCASILFFPVLWGAALLLFVVLLAAVGFAGLGHLSNLPLVADHGFAIAGVAHHALGFYAWCAGIVAVFVGMLGQLALRRR
jgi:hypothetical protein